MGTSVSPCPTVGIGAARGIVYSPENEAKGRGLHSSTSQPFLVTETTASVHLSAQPETFLPMQPPKIAHKKYKKCSPQAE
jgi:hypothetical protein